MWIQNYDPMGDWRLSTLVASIPILVLLGLLITGRAHAWLAAVAGLLTALLVAVVFFRMPVALAFNAAALGSVFAIFRIVWLIVAAVFLYNIAVETGQFEIMKQSIARLSPDRRLQAVLVAFCFGAFIEGAAGFGAPVAISAAFLVGLGFPTFQAALLCLIANTAPVAWGSIGTPIKTLAAVTQLDVEALSAMSGRILPPLSLIIPIWLVAALAGLRATVPILPALLVIGGTFATVQWAWSNYVGVDLVDLASAVASLIAGVAVLSIWQPRQIWRLPEDVPYIPKFTSAGELRAQQVARAWMPFGLLSVAVLAWGLPGNKLVLEQLDARFGNKTPLAGLHAQVVKGPDVTGHGQVVDGDREDARLTIVPFSSTGTAVFLAAVVSGLLLGLRPRRLSELLVETVRQLGPAIATVLAMLALGFVTRYSGTDAVLGLACTRTGAFFYPIFGTLLGWLGVALTGSDTSSNVLFGNLQRITADKLGLSPILMASANTTGGVMGKMVDAQSIVVAAAATGEGGHEGRLLRAVLWHSVVLALLVGVVVWFYAHTGLGQSLVPPVGRS